MQRFLSHINRSLGILVGLIFLFGSCFDSLDEEFDKQLEKDLAIIDQYLVENSITAEQDPTHRIRYVVHEFGPGTGHPSVDTSCVRLQFVGKFMDSGASFTESPNSSYPLAGDLIEGWKLGIPLLKTGDSATFYIPSGLAYGRYGIEGEGIPPNANVIFILKLLAIGTVYSATPSPTGSCH